MMTSAPLSGPVRTKTMHEHAFRSIRDAIMDGSLPSGTRLIQSTLASQLDVSITPIREALRDLATEGLVTFDPHRGALVRALDLGEVREIYELRMTLEPLLVRRISSRITDHQLGVAQDTQHRMELTDDPAEWVELNREFHTAITFPDDPSRLAAILSGLRDSAATYVRLSLGANPERREQSNIEHRQLIRLFRQHDFVAVEKLTVQHLQTTLSTIEDAHALGLL